jgi:beta-xylosidase
MQSLTRLAMGVAAMAALLLLEACGTTSAATATKKFTNPVFRQNFPDPAVIRVGKTYYAYATTTDNEDIATLTSTDLVHWKAGKDALPVPPLWAVSDYWAPQVFESSPGHFVLWFAAADMAVGGQHCVGFATANSPKGPFKSSAKKAAICDSNQGGDIDPDVFRDKGQTYVLWKNDGNSMGVTTWLWAQKANAAATKLVGKPVKLDYNHQSWEGNLIEAPFMWKHGGTYFLFFSANAYNSYNYAVGYATCKSPLGPCTDNPKNPILTSNCDAAGPGGETIITDTQGQTWMVYHAWKSSAVGDETVGRLLWIDRLSWPHNKPVVHGPTCKAQLAPAT